MRDAPRPEAITHASAAGVRAAEIRVTHQLENNVVALLDRKPRQEALRARHRARAGTCAVRRAGSMMCEAAWAASHTRDTYLSAQYRRFKRRMGTKSEGKAIFAVAHPMIVIVWHLRHENTNYAELGADYFDKRNDAAARQRYLIRELEKLGNTVTLEPAA